MASIPGVGVRVFSYGSNSIAQLRERVGRVGAFEFEPATLRDHARVFAGFSKRWGGAVASVHPSDGQAVRGLVVTLSQQELEILDTYEGHYTRVQRQVWAQRQGPVHACIYIKDDTGYSRPPSAAYLTAIWRMLGDGGHADAAIDINHVDEGGRVCLLSSWQPGMLDPAEQRA